MIKGVSDSLAGRVCALNLSSLTDAEINGRNEKVFSAKLSDLKKKDFVKKDINAIFEKMYKGGMPKIIVDNVDAERYYMDYVNTYIERDVKELFCA